MLYRSANGRYRVDVAVDGAIDVKPNDWLSKYSAAIRKNFTTIREYARKDRSGQLVPIKNVNLIYTGETLYHLPTYYQSHEVTFDQGAGDQRPGGAAYYRHRKEENHARLLAKGLQVEGRPASDPGQGH